MKNIIFNILHDIYLYLLKRLDLYSAYLLKVDSVLREDGWFRSIKEEKCVDVNGNPLPWLAYPAIEFLKHRIHQGMSVFEYGAGSSTLWWASRVKDVITVENDMTWYKKMLPLIPQNVRLHHIELEYGGTYSKKILEYECKFDVVIIDGRDRVNCAINSVRALKENGIIVWDNSDRKEYEKGYKYLFEHSFKKIEFIGLAPIIYFKSETGIFYRPDNCLGV